MLQNSGNNRNEGQNDSGNASVQPTENKRYEGFEGMNYEQPRQPYQPRQKKNARERSGKEPGSSEAE